MTSKSVPVPLQGSACRWSRGPILMIPELNLLFSNFPNICKFEIGTDAPFVDETRFLFRACGAPGALVNALLVSAYVRRG